MKKKLINRLTERWINKILVSSKEREIAKSAISRLKKNIKINVEDYLKICKDIDSVKTDPNGNVHLFDSNGSVATLWIHRPDGKKGIYEIDSIRSTMYNYDKFDYKKKNKNE